MEGEKLSEDAVLHSLNDRKEIWNIKRFEGAEGKELIGKRTKKMVNGCV